jgi:hypothetical protein
MSVTTPHAPQTSHAAAIRWGPFHGETMAATLRKQAKNKPAIIATHAPAVTLTISFTAVRSLTFQQESLDLTERLSRGGRASDPDVTRARQLVDQQTGLIPSLEAARRNALFRLATLTGKPPALFERDLETRSSPPRLTRILPVGDGAALLKRRPDVRQAERELASGTANIGVQTAQLYPDVAIGVQLGSVGAAHDAYTSPTNFWGVGPLLKWQANQSAARARIEGAKASAKLALANFDGVVLGALRDAETSLNTYVHDLQREDSTRKARDEAERAARDSEQLQVAGRATALAVVDSQRAYAAAEQTLAQLETAIAEDQIAVFLALGGGLARRDCPRHSRIRNSKPISRRASLPRLASRIARLARQRLDDVRVVARQRGAHQVEGRRYRDDRPYSWDKRFEEQCEIDYSGTSFCMLATES